MVKSIAIAGTVIGWGSAAGLAITGGDGHAFFLVQNLVLAVGMLSVWWLLASRRRRPMSAAFELGFEMGRREAFKERNQPRKGTPMREYLEQREREAANS